MKRSPIDFQSLDDNIISERNPIKKRETLEKLMRDMDKHEQRHNKWVFLKPALSIAAFVGVLFLAFHLTSSPIFNEDTNVPSPNSQPNASDEDPETPSNEEEVEENNEETIEEREVDVEEEDPVAKYGEFYIVEDDYISVNTHAVELIDEGREDEIHIEVYNIKDSAENMERAFKEVPWHEKSKLDEFGFTDDYYYYLEASAVLNSLGQYGFIQVTGEEIERQVAEIVAVAEEMAGDDDGPYPQGEEMERLVEKMRKLTVEFNEYINGE
ncbi:hypothetical protein [Alkalihalobacterium bogoriense]|uniref:hypothetical protein n=1 Tax=Alkalihalobacterium bogoriense TaxID=246272 RepID=UPI00047B8C1D|nr:hypothetical protein [Alkalihalobacterium bogoriense]